MDKSWKSFEAVQVSVGKSVDCLEGTIDRNTDIKGDSGKVLGENEEQFIGSWRRGNPCYKMGKTLTELCSSVL